MHNNQETRQITIQAMEACGITRTAKPKIYSGTVNTVIDALRGEVPDNDGRVCARSLIVEYPKGTAARARKYAFLSAYHALMWSRGFNQEHHEFEARDCAREAHFWLGFNQPA